MFSYYKICLLYHVKSRVRVFEGVRAHKAFFFCTKMTVYEHKFSYLFIIYILRRKNSKDQFSSEFFLASISQEAPNGCNASSPLSYELYVDKTLCFSSIILVFLEYS